jgi:hypothetical protein
MSGKVTTWARVEGAVVEWQDSGDRSPWLELRGGCWLVAAAACLSAACTARPLPTAPTQQAALVSDYSSASASSSEYSTVESGSGKGLSVPHRTRLTDPTRLSLRPDLYTLTFAVREQRENSHAALDAARASSDRVSAELLKVFGTAATTKVNGFTLTRLTQGSEQLGILAVVDATLEVRLAESQDFWVRSRLFTTLVETTQRLAEAASSPQNPLRAISFEPPRAEVRDPEAYRPELLKRWVTRIQEFTTAAQAEAAPLVVRDCTPPGAVTQAARSFDEVSLELSITCRIDTAAAAGTSHGGLHLGGG